MRGAALGHSQCTGAFNETLERAASGILSRADVHALSAHIQHHESPVLPDIYICSHMAKEAAPGLRHFSQHSQ